MLEDVKNGKHQSAPVAIQANSKSLVMGENNQCFNLAIF